MIDPNSPSVKSTAILKILNEQCKDRGKVVISGNSVRYLGVLANVLHARGFAVYTFTGNETLTSATDRHGQRDFDICNRQTDMGNETSISATDRHGERDFDICNRQTW